MKLIQKWFPSAPGGDLAVRLGAFYAERDDYHEMTSSEAKLQDPQVKLLECLVRPEGRYLEVGCGGGVVARKIARSTRVTGIDGSSIAIRKAIASVASGERCEFKVATAYALPVDDSSMDGVYSFEVLEHLLDPVAAVEEMVRVLRPGGFLLLSAPNRFSLDLHLKKNIQARCADLLMAGLRAVRDEVMHEPFVLFEPELEGQVYPDCDAVSCIVPSVFFRELERMGMEMVFWDSGYMCAHRDGVETDLEFQRTFSKGWRRHFGDHFLILFKKIDV